MAEFDYEVVNGRKIRVRPQEVVSEIAATIWDGQSFATGLPELRS